MPEADDRPERRFATWTFLDGGIAHVEEYAAKFELNETGTFLWLLCDGSRTAGELADELAAAFAVDEGRALHDTSEFLVWLRQARLLEPARATEASRATPAIPSA